MAQSCNLARNVPIPRRSVSFPSRLPSSNPLKIVSGLRSLRDSASIAPPCSKTIEMKLGKLAELYESVGEIVMSLRDRNGRATVEGAVDNVILLLDVCGYARDMVSSTKQEVQDLQSVLRRKSRGGSVEVERQVGSFVRFRKNTRRAASKHLDSLKRLERKNSVVSTRFVNSDDEHSVMVCESLRELCGITVTILESLLLFLCPSPKGGSCGRSLVSRLVLWTGGGKQRSDARFNAAEGIDSVIHSLTKKQTGHEAWGFEDARRVNHRALEEMINNCILGLEEGLDCLHTSLIRNRVCLLNLLTN